MEDKTKSKIDNNLLINEQEKSELKNRILSVISTLVKSEEFDFLYEIKVIIEKILLDKKGDYDYAAEKQQNFQNKEYKSIDNQRNDKFLNFQNKLKILQREFTVFQKEIKKELNFTSLFFETVNKNSPNVNLSVQNVQSNGYIPNIPKIPLGGINNNTNNIKYDNTAYSSNDSARIFEKRKNFSSMVFLVSQTNDNKLNYSICRTKNNSFKANNLSPINNYYKSNGGNRKFVNSSYGILSNNNDDNRKKSVSYIEILKKRQKKSDLIRRNRLKKYREKELKRISKLGIKNGVFMGNYSKNPKLRGLIFKSKKKNEKIK